MRAAFIGEILGTFLMVLFGTGSVACAVLTGALQGLWQVAIIWGIGVAISIHCVAGLSGAHLNPAVSLAFAVIRPRDFSWRKLPLYWIAQLSGSVLAGGTVWAVFGSLLARFEVKEGLVRGAAGSERAAMIFGEYFPNPALFGTGADVAGLVSPIGAFAVEAVGTGILMIVILALTDTRNASAPPRFLVPLLIGLTVATLIGIFAPITQAGWNPARDFGPRIVAYLIGFGAVAIPGPRQGFWVYILGPMAGAVIGGALYEILRRLAAAPTRHEHPDIALARSPD